jgi:hypothetical protein
MLGFSFICHMNALRGIVLALARMMIVGLQNNKIDLREFFGAHSPPMASHGPHACLQKPTPKRGKFFTYEIWTIFFGGV